MSAYLCHAFLLRFHQRLPPGKIYFERLELLVCVIKLMTFIFSKSTFANDHHDYFNRMKRNINKKTHDLAIEVFLDLCGTFDGRCDHCTF